jgi:uncharacterized membrane protein YagU involved in acid resistance
MSELLCSSANISQSDGLIKTVFAATCVVKKGFCVIYIEFSLVYAKNYIMASETYYCVNLVC